MAVFVAGRNAGLEGRDEWTLFVGGEQLANEVAKRIGGGLIVDEVKAAAANVLHGWEGDNTIVSEIGRSGLIAAIDTSGGNYAYHTLTNPRTGAVADVTYDRNFGSYSTGVNVYSDTAYPLFRDAVLDEDVDGSDEDIHPHTGLTREDHHRLGVDNVQFKYLHHAKRYEAVGSTLEERDDGWGEYTQTQWIARVPEGLVDDAEIAAVDGEWTPWLKNWLMGYAIPEEHRR